MDKKIQRVLAVNLAVNQVVENRRREAACVENIGWTDEARAASLAVRRGMAASRQLGGPVKSAPAGAGVSGAPLSKRWPGDQPPVTGGGGAGGNADTEYEGTRIVGYGGVYEVQNGVLRRVGNHVSGGFSYGGGVRVGKGSGASGVVGAANFKATLKKMADAGVNVIDGFGPIPKDIRTYAERIYGVKERPPIQY